MKKKYLMSMREGGGFATGILMIQISDNMVLIGKRISPMEAGGLPMSRQGLPMTRRGLPMTGRGL